MARADGAPIDIDSVANRLVAPEYARVAQSLLEVGFSSGYQLFGTFASSSADVRRWLAGAAINHDKDLRLQYLAGLALNQQTGDDIFRQILRNRVWPSQDFTGSDAGIAMLTEVLVR
jgi:spermidine synthase